MRDDEHGDPKHERLASSIMRAVQDVLTRGLNDPRITGMLTVTQIELTPDRAQATLHISVLPGGHESRVIHALTDAAAFIRREIGEKLRTRQMPALRFVHDLSLKKQSQVLQAIHKATSTAPTPQSPWAPPASSSPPPEENRP